jgi:hypothetical protein
MKKENLKVGQQVNVKPGIERFMRANEHRTGVFWADQMNEKKFCSAPVTIYKLLDEFMSDPHDRYPDHVSIIINGDMSWTVPVAYLKRINNKSKSTGIRSEQLRVGAKVRIKRFKKSFKGLHPKYFGKVVTIDGLHPNESNYEIGFGISAQHPIWGNNSFNIDELDSAYGVK